MQHLFTYLHIDGDDYLPGSNAAQNEYNAKLSVLAIKFPVFEETDELPLSRKWYKNHCSKKFACKIVNPAEVTNKFGNRGAFRLSIKNNLSQNQKS